MPLIVRLGFKKAIEPVNHQRDDRENTPRRKDGQACRLCRGHHVLVGIARKASDQERENKERHDHAVDPKNEVITLKALEFFKAYGACGMGGNRHYPDGGQTNHHAIDAVKVIGDEGHLIQKALVLFEADHAKAKQEAEDDHGWDMIICHGLERIGGYKKGVPVDFWGRFDHVGTEESRCREVLKGFREDKGRRPAGNQDHRIHQKA